jgi:hypothetical protein
LEDRPTDPVKKQEVKSRPTAGLLYGRPESPWLLIDPQRMQLSPSLPQGKWPGNEKQAGEPQCSPACFSATGQKVGQQMANKATVRGNGHLVRFCGICFVALARRKVEIRKQ